MLYNKKNSKKKFENKRYLNKKSLIFLMSTMVVAIPVATAVAGQTYDDYSIGISVAFDQYADSVLEEQEQKAVSEINKSDVSVTSATTKKSSSDEEADTTSGEEDKASDATSNEDKYSEFSGKCIAVSSDYINIRSEASADSDVVGIIENNGVATVIEKGDEWTKVTSGECQGYIRNDLLLFGDDAETYAESNLDKSAEVTAETLYVRAEASAASDCLTMVGQGQSFDILSQSDDWIEINIPEEGTGYVSADYVEITYDLPEAKTVEQIEAEQLAREQAEKAQEEAEKLSQEADNQTQDSIAEDEQNLTEQTQNTLAADTTEATVEVTTEATTETTTEAVTEATTEVTTETTTETTTESVAAPSGQTGVDLANYATQFVGNPYVYGGSSLTDGADCSGFVMAVYAQFGYSLPHSAGAQSGYGTKVDTSSLEPGDIVFYGSDGVIGHCGIYIGSGNIVHASNEETGIKISNYLYRTPMCAVRLIGQ